MPAVEAHLCIEDDAQRLVSDTAHAGGQARAVANHRLHADQHRLVFRAEPVRHPARPCTRNPLRVARVRGNLAVQTHRRLKRDEGTVVPTPVEIDAVSLPPAHR
jgi:hypothetical protein